MDLPGELCSECSNCNGTGSYFDTPQYRPGGLGIHSGHCRDCGWKGLTFTPEGMVLLRFVEALKFYPKDRNGY